MCVCVGGGSPRVSVSVQFSPVFWVVTLVVQPLFTTGNLVKHLKCVMHSLSMWCVLRCVYCLSGMFTGNSSLCVCVCAASVVFSFQ